MLGSINKYSDFLGSIKVFLAEAYAIEQWAPFSLNRGNPGQELAVLMNNLPVIKALTLNANSFKLI